MGCLSHSSIYLCGQVEHDPKCSIWRKQVTNDIYLRDPTINVWNPMCMPNWTTNVNKAFDNDIHNSEAWQANIEVRKISKLLANHCSILLARITRTFTWGSIDELEIAIDRNIPIFLWLPDGIISTYGIPGCITDYEYILDYIHYSMDSIINKIDNINNGTDDLVQRDKYRWISLTY